MGQLIRFLTVGVANTVFGLALIWGAMRIFGLGEAAANALGYGCGIILSFTLNRAWTFVDAGRLSRSFPRWLAVTAVAYLANLGAVLVACRVVGVDAYLAQLAGIPVYTAIGFLGARYVVFSTAHPALSASA